VLFTLDVHYSQSAAHQAAPSALTINVSDYPLFWFL
jgi:hypothetical protein